MSKTTKIIISVIAIAVILAAALFLIYKYTKKEVVNEPEEIIVEPNLTIFRCHMGKVITDVDLDEIKEVAKEAVGDKFYEIENGSVIKNPDVTDENGEIINLGDAVTITFKILSDEEKIAVFNAFVEKYGIDNSHLIEGIGKDAKLILSGRFDTCLPLTRAEARHTVEQKHNIVSKIGGYQYSG